MNTLPPPTSPWPGLEAGCLKAIESPPPRQLPDGTWEIELRFEILPEPPAEGK